MDYILKNGEKISSIPIGRSKVIIGETNSKKTLTVVDRGPNKGNSRGAMVICKCICGKYTYIKLQSFKDETTYSCGCLSKIAFQENGKRVGNLEHKTKDYTQVNNIFYKYIKQLEEKNENGYYWLIECKKCGKQYKAIPSQLISQNRRKGNNPCSCWRKDSKGILKIIDLLDNNRIPYIREKSFDTCRSPKNNLFYYDFFVNNRYLIEYDGEQHFIPEKFNINKDGDEALKIQNLYDNLKNQWCKDNNIPLIRISYLHYKDLKIEDLLLETSTFIV